MKKIIKLILFLTPLWGAGGLFAQNTDTTDTGVVINGITWATRNVDTPGTFAKTPESAGMFYQWNRKKAWNVTDKEVVGWDKSTPQGIEWEKVNDPCPVGWQVPTKENQLSLFDSKKVIDEWTIQNGITGRKFTNIATGNFLFLPLAGYRNPHTGGLNFVGTYGEYWGSTPHERNESYAYNVNFDEDIAIVYYYLRSAGFLVRCVLVE